MFLFFVVCVCVFVFVPIISTIMQRSLGHQQNGITVPPVKGIYTSLKTKHGPRAPPKDVLWVCRE